MQHVAKLESPTAIEYMMLRSRMRAAPVHGAAWTDLDAFLHVCARVQPFHGFQIHDAANVSSLML
jgi:hypothetical protein